MSSVNPRSVALDKNSYEYEILMRTLLSQGRSDCSRRQRFVKQARVPVPKLVKMSVESFVKKRILFFDHSGLNTAL